MKRAVEVATLALPVNVNLCIVWNRLQYWDVWNYLLTQLGLGSTHFKLSWGKWNKCWNLFLIRNGHQSNFVFSHYKRIEIHPELNREQNVVPSSSKKHMLHLLFSCWSCCELMQSKIFHKLSQFSNSMAWHWHSDITVNTSL